MAADRNVGRDSIFDVVNELTEQMHKTAREATGYVESLQTTRGVIFVCGNY